MAKYVSQFNGYLVKDKVARENLETKADKTQIDELLELIRGINESISNLPIEAKELPFDDSTTLLGATNVQDAIDLVKKLTEKLTGSSADGVSFDDTTANLYETDLQGAIEKLKELHDTLSNNVLNLKGENVTYYNGVSGIEAGTLQGAVDKLKILIDELDLKYNKNYIIEYGSNDKGHFRKWADGTLEMWGVKSQTFKFSSGNNFGAGLYYSNIYGVTLPLTSLTKCAIVINITSSSVLQLFKSSSYNDNDSFGVGVISTAQADVNADLSFKAVGTWK